MTFLMLRICASSFTENVTIYIVNQHVSATISEVHERCKRKGVSLSAAESCTGGLISHYITELPGASEFFTSGIVSYSEDIKKRLLGISSETISLHGVVSAETACEMAEKIRRLAKTDYSVSSTGNLGPEVLEDKDKGLVYVAASREGKTISKELRLNGSRKENKEEAAVEALKLLIELLNEE